MSVGKLEKEKSSHSFKKLSKSGFKILLATIIYIPKRQRFFSKRSRNINRDLGTIGYSSGFNNMIPLYISFRLTSF